MFWIVMLTTCFFACGFSLGTLMTNRRRDRRAIGVTRLTKRTHHTALDISSALAIKPNQRRQVIPLFTPPGVK